MQREVLTLTSTTRVPQLVILSSLLTNYIAVAGKDFCIIAADTRMSLGYNILSRNHSKSTKLTDGCVITSGGMVADIETLHKLLVAKV